MYIYCILWIIMHYRHTSFGCTLKILNVLQIVLWQTVSCKAVSASFTEAFTHLVSPCHILIVLEIFKTSIMIIFAMVICDYDLWHYRYDSLKTQVMVSYFFFLAIKYF